MDAEGLGRKLLTPSGDPRRTPEKQTLGTVTASHKILTLQALSSSLNAGTVKWGCLGRGEAFGCPPAVCPLKRPRPFAHYRLKGPIQEFLVQATVLQKYGMCNRAGDNYNDRNPPEALKSMPVGPGRYKQSSCWVKTLRLHQVFFMALPDAFAHVALIFTNGRGLGTGKRGHYERGLFTGEISRISRFSRIFVENCRILLCSPQSGVSLKSLEFLNSPEFLENGLY